MTNRPILFLVSKEKGGGYVARAKEAMIHVSSPSLDELVAMIQEALELHFESNEVPPVFRLCATFPSDHKG